MERRNAEELVRRWANEGVAAGRLEVFDELLHEDVRDLSGGKESVGRATFKARASAVNAAFSNRSVNVEALLVEGDRLAWRWTLRGAHTGRFLDIDPTGIEIALAGVNFQRMADGRVIEHYTLVDVAALERVLREAASRGAPAS